MNLKFFNYHIENDELPFNIEHHIYENKHFKITIDTYGSMDIRIVVYILNKKINIEKMYVLQNPFIEKVQLEKNYNSIPIKFKIIIDSFLLILKLS